MTEEQFESNLLRVQREPELLTTEEVVDRVKRLQTELNAEQTVFMAERSSYGLQNEQLRIWLQKVDAVEILVNRFNVACVRLLNTLTMADAAQQVSNLEQLRLRISQQMKLVRTEAKVHHAREPAPGHTITMGGCIKPAWLSDERFEQYQFGTFGQDVLLVDHHNGSVVVADGTSTFPDLYSVANVTAHACEDMLANVSEEFADNLEQLQWYAEAAEGTIITALEELPPSTIGSTAVFAARYFRKFDALVVIEIGDCEAALATADAVQGISYTVPRSGALPHIQKNKHQLAAVVDPQKKPLVRVVSVTEFRRAHPNRTIHLVGGSDGLHNNSGLTLEQQARAIVRDGVQTTLKHCALQKDDMTLFDLELNSAEV